MAIAVNGGHVNRALDFYNTPGKYFIIGGTTPWTDETTPDAPSPTDFKLKDVVGLKRVDNSYLVVPDENGTIQYRTQNWRIVPPTVSTTIAAPGVTEGSIVVPVESVAGITEGSKIRVGDIYEGKIQSISGNHLTLDIASPSAIATGSKVLGGAMAEGAHYVYVECYLNYNQFPLVTYRQIGLCTRVSPSTEDKLLSAEYSSTTANEYTSLGTLEILDNRVPSTRDANQREMLSLIIEF